MSFLSPRLQFLYDQLIPGQPVWDFCCDHGYLGLSAAISGVFPEVHFVDQVPEIMQRLKVRYQEVSEKISIPTPVTFHQCSGEKVPGPLQGNVVIAGVGGHTVFEIVKGLHQRGLLTECRLILSPHRHEEHLVEWLQSLSDFPFLSLPRVLGVSEKGRQRRVLVYDARQIEY